MSHMLRAIELSQEKMHSGEGGPFGAVIVKEDKIIAEGWNCVTSKNDPTAHAEVEAIRKASAKLNAFDLSGCTIFTSCEPCPMCLSAIYWARIDKIYYGNSRMDAATIGFADDFLYTELQLPLGERKIPIIKMHPQEAWQVFEEWQAKADKISY